MLKHELKKLAIIAAIGFIIMLLIMIILGKPPNDFLWIVPVYCTGMFYAGELLPKAILKIVKGLISLEYMSLLTRPFLGTFLCIVLLIISVICLASIGWIIGLFKCIHCLYVAYYQDKKLHFDKRR